MIKKKLLKKLLCNPFKSLFFLYVKEIHVPVSGRLVMNNLKFLGDLFMKRFPRASEVFLPKRALRISKYVFNLFYEGHTSSACFFPTVLRLGKSNRAADYQNFIYSEYRFFHLEYLGKMMIYITKL